jgi:alpha-maltose-1-phosphate synthase
METVFPESISLPEGRAEGAVGAGEPLRVVLLSMEYGPDLSGGVGTHAREVSAGLAQCGHEVDAVVFGPGAPGTFHDAGVTVHPVPPRETAAAGRLSMAQAIRAFNAELVAYGRKLFASRAHRPDLLQFYNWLTFPAARQLGAELGIPLLGRFSFLSEPIERWWGQTPDPEIVECEREVFREPVPLIAVSHSMAEVIERTHGTPRTSMDVIHNGIDERTVGEGGLAPEARRRLRRTIAEEGEPIILFAGRLNPQKGIAPLLESASQVVAAEPRVRYLMAGEPDSRDFRRVIDEILDRHPGLRSRITFLGRVPRKQLSLLYQIADLAVMPSIYEPFGWVAIEAMAAGLPLVTTAAGGPAEIAVHRRTGLLVPVHQAAAGHHTVDAGELAAAQLEILRDRDMARQMGEEGRRRVLTEFTRERMIQATIRTYRKVAASAGLAAR